MDILYSGLTCSVLPVQISSAEFVFYVVSFDTTHEYDLKDRFAEVQRLRGESDYSAQRAYYTAMWMAS